ncbi:thiol:disulfide interchange protein DsbA/DsbL [Caldimonas brevitalea]|uniref:Thiol:disulfide interchange protein n=1 Tax=Caldimonas brevitalea TaxID=413882 RepID=A0A0G3BHS5_9BURK|nr:thiol:disulfide interchange protein DsbA/DsbL [Caldimonas brevitalea]AKJ26906.1 DSBA oxidoreductase [Caldimonas brevitalea]
MKRREFTGGLAAWVGGSSVAPLLAGTAATLGTAAAQAQTPKPGTDYVVLKQAQPTAATKGIEVVEFFWYGCPHCYRFEPLLEAWVKKLPADVSFRRVPVAFRDEFVVHQKIYYALEALGKVDALHKRVFQAVHADKNPLDQTEAIADFMARNGVDRAAFLDAYNSFGVQTKTRQAKQLAEGYRIDGVPALGINGRYWTSGALARSLERSLDIADHLIQVSRTGK